MYYRNKKIEARKQRYQHALDDIACRQMAIHVAGLLKEADKAVLVQIDAAEKHQRRAQESASIVGIGGGSGTVALTNDQLITLLSILQLQQQHIVSTTAITETHPETQPGEAIFHQYARSLGPQVLPIKSAMNMDNMELNQTDEKNEEYEEEKYNNLNP